MIMLKKIISIAAVLCLTAATTVFAGEALPDKYDSRDFGIVTPVRDQGDTNLCWAYSTAAASESSILKKGIDKSVSAGRAFLSPQQIGYARNIRGADPLNNTVGEKNAYKDSWQNAKGGIMYSASLLSMWCGPVGANMMYNVNGWENAKYKLESAIQIDGNKLKESEAARDKMKRAIMKYGAVTFSYNNVRELAYYNPNGETTSSPHACTVIGWDDTIPASKFGPGKTTTDGGWLVKNSYNSLPYFYLSYEVTSDQVYAFDYALCDKYDYNYFYDGLTEDFLAAGSIKSRSAVCIYESKGGENEYIKAVSVGIVGENAECTVKIYNINGDVKAENASLAAEKKVTFEYGGYNCIELDKPVKAGAKFAVLAETDNNAYIRLCGTESNSYLLRGYGWVSGATPRIKAFTKIINNSVKFLDTSRVEVKTSETNKLVFAKYEGGRLSDVRMQSVNDSGIISLPNEWIKGDNTMYKAFLLDKDNLSPVCAAAYI